MMGRYVNRRVDKKTAALTYTGNNENSNYSANFTYGILKKAKLLKMMNINSGVPMYVIL